MADGTDGQEGQQPDDGGKSGFTPPATQEELNKIIGERLERERAKFGDYADLQAKAAKLDEIEDANRSEIEKATEKAAQAEAKVAEIPAKVAEQLRTHLVALHEIPDEDAELFLTASDPELLLKQTERLVGRKSEQRRTGNYVPREGATLTEPKEDEMREFTRALFQGSD